MKRLFLYISIAAACSCHAAADNNSAFEAKVSEILSNNPTLASRRANAEAESLNLRADNNLSDPELEFEHQWGTPSVGGNKWSVSVSQSFDWPGVYHNRAKAPMPGAGHSVCSTLPKNLTCVCASATR